MNLIDRVERAIVNTGAELHQIPLNGLKAVTVKVGNKVAVFADVGAFSRVSELASAEAHEYGHVKSGAFYDGTSDGLTILRQEYRADKAAIRRFLPPGKIKKAMSRGFTETWQLSDLLGFEESFIRRAIYIYKTEGKL